MQNMSSGKSALGLDGNLAAALGYPIGIIALILIFMEKDNRFVKFHALQSIFFYIMYVVVIIAYIIITSIITFVLTQISSALALIGLLFWLFTIVLVLAFLGALIFAAVKAYGNNWFKLPIVGNMAEKMANK